MTTARPQTIADAHRALVAGELTSEALTRACLDRIAERRDLNAFIAVFEETAVAEAREADRELAAGRVRGALHGIPISLKDIIDMRGVRTSAASRVRAGHVAPDDAPVTTNLRDAGAILIGKCNLHEFAFGTTSEDSAYGAVRNPANPGHVAGGSSGGSAAAVAAGMSLASIGTDTGGSIRIPAAACGVVGLKPTLNEVSTAGVVPLSRSLDHVGPIARTVADAWIVFRALIGRRAEPPPAPRPVANVRIGVPRPYFFDVVDGDVRARIEEALDRVRRAGASVVDVTIPGGDEIAPIYLHLALPEAAAYHATALESCPDLYLPSVRLRLEMGRTMLAEDYVRAQVGRERLRARVDRALGEHGLDALALPALAIPAPALGAAFVDVDGRSEPVRNVMLRLTQPFNLSGHPAISLPCGTARAGLPVGLQLVGHYNRTDELLLTALACERYIGVDRGISGGGGG
jgi:aspartyl-tRNA(Asn)/glutamyl-tRNA(Gln) amidotransferase subunit A